MKYWYLGFILLTHLVYGGAQVNTGDKIKVEHADNYALQIKDTNHIQVLTGHVVLSHNESILQCDSATILNETYVQADSNIIITQGDSLTIFSDRLTYNADTENARLLNNVILVSEDKQLFTTALDYQLDTRVARYNAPSSIKTDSILLASNSGVYWVADKRANFFNEVYVEHEDFQLFSDTVGYEFDKEIASFTGPSILITKDSTSIYAESGSYNQPKQLASFFINAIYSDSLRTALADTILYWQKDSKAFLRGEASILEQGRAIKGHTIEIYGQTKQFYAEGNAQIVESPQIISADKIQLDDSLGMGWAIGTVQWEDTLAGMSIKCDTAQLTNEGQTIIAYNNSFSRPLLALEMEEDTLYLGSDTLKSISLIDSLQKDTVRTFYAFHDVRVYKRDLQLICDSLHYAESTGKFSFYDNPVMWSDTSAFYADSIFMFLIDKTMDKLQLIGNGFMVNSPDEILFNQIKGRTIDIEFSNEEIDKVLVNGNAETIYYVLDEDDAYVGVNQSSSSYMIIQFKEGDVDLIKNFNDVESDFIPIQEVDQEALKLEGFRWDNTYRPTSILSLINTKRIKK